MINPLIDYIIKMNLRIMSYPSERSKDLQLSLIHNYIHPKCHITLVNNCIISSIHRFLMVFYSFHAGIPRNLLCFMVKSLWEKSIDFWGSNQPFNPWWTIVKHHFLTCHNHFFMNMGWIISDIDFDIDNILEI